MIMIFVRKLFSIWVLSTILLFYGNNLHSQNIERAREIMDTLSSASMFGRGYVNNGTGIAADYLANEMRQIGLQPLVTGYEQHFFADVKTYPSVVDLSIDGKVLKAGVDFTILTGSPTTKRSFNLITIDSTLFIKEGKLRKLQRRDLTNTMLVYDPLKMKGTFRKMADSLLFSNFLNCAGFIHLHDKSSISWSVVSPDELLPYPVINVLVKSMPARPHKAEVKIEVKPIDNFKLSNVIGYIAGTSAADSLIIITAHYDHLGMLGKDACFPGANDNASGTAMMLDMAAHFNAPENRLPFSMVFIAFAGEELGLKGSNYCAESSVIELKKVKFLINLDMVGTGSEGITMVNGAQFPSYYQRMVNINNEKGYIEKVAKRGESCNSDHCPFYKKGVPAVFIYSMGKEHVEYHNINDSADKVPFTEYEDIFRLITDFINTL